MTRPVEHLTYTIPEAAQAVGVCGNTIRALVRSGDLPAMHIARRTLISRQALEDWMAANANARLLPRGVRRPNRRGAGMEGV